MYLLCRYSRRIQTRNFAIWQVNMSGMSKPCSWCSILSLHGWNLYLNVLGVGAKHCGLYGDTNGYYRTVEQQGHLTLHLHMLICIKGSLNPQEMREKIMSSNSEWKNKLISWLEICHTGEFLTGTHADISKKSAEISQSDNYSDPTETMPEPPPPRCNDAHIMDETSSCKCCKNTHVKEVKRKMGQDVRVCLQQAAKITNGVDAKYDSPDQPFLKSVIYDTGAITMKKIEPWLNTFTPLVTYIFCCNTDVASLSSGTAIKAVVIYVSDYITKTTLKTHTIFDSIWSVFHKNSEMIEGTLPTQEKACRIMTKIVNLLSAKAEMGSTMICMYLLGNPDHHTSHMFVPFYWQSFVTQVRQDFDADKQEVQKITLIKKKGKIVGLSPVYDYIYWSPDLEDICLYNWVQRFQCKKIKKSKSENCSTAETNELIDDDYDVFFESDTEIDITKAQSTLLRSTHCMIHMHHV